MKTRSFHITNMGSYGNLLIPYVVNQGYVEIHDEPETYEAMSDQELRDIVYNERDGEYLGEDNEEPKEVRAAAQFELSSRALAEWQKGNL